MKAIATALGVFLMLALTGRSDVISPRDAGDHVGEIVTVSGEVVQVKVAERAIFINLAGTSGGRYLNIVTFNMTLGDALKRYQGKSVSITGKVKMYKGKPEIVLEGMSQITK